MSPARKLIPGSAEWLPLGSLVIGADNPYQRDLKEATIAKIADHFDPSIFGVIEVARRPAARKGGVPTDWVKDGQNRCTGALRAGCDASDLVLCHVVVHDTVADEARVARGMNKGRTAWAAYDDFKAGLVAQDAQCLAVNAILTKVGLAASPGASRSEVERGGLVFAISTCMSLGSDEIGRELLLRTLRTATGAWTHTPGGLRTTVLNGLASFLAQHWDGVNEERLTEILAREDPDDLVDQARLLKRKQVWGISTFLAVIVEGRYNHRLSSQSNRLREYYASSYATAVNDWRRDQKYRRQQAAVA